MELILSSYSIRPPPDPISQPNQKQFFHVLLILIAINEGVFFLFTEGNSNRQYLAFMTFSRTNVHTKC